MSSETQQTQSEDNNKVAKEFDKNIKTLVAIVGGDKNIYPTKKVKKDTVNTIVEGLLKERKEKAEADIKIDLIAILDKKVLLDKEFKAEEEKLAKLKISKQKEFNEAFKKIVSRVENINELEKDYYDTLTVSSANDNTASASN